MGVFLPLELDSAGWTGCGRQRIKNGQTPASRDLTHAKSPNKLTVTTTKAKDNNDKKSSDKETQVIVQIQ